MIRKWSVCVDGFEYEYVGDRSFKGKYVDSVGNIICSDVKCTLDNGDIDMKQAMSKYVTIAEKTSQSCMFALQCIHTFVSRVKPKLVEAFNNKDCFYLDLNSNLVIAIKNPEYMNGVLKGIPIGKVSFDRNFLKEYLFINDSISSSLEMYAIQKSSKYLLTLYKDLENKTTLLEFQDVLLLDPPLSNQLVVEQENKMSTQYYYVDGCLYLLK